MKNIYEIEKRWYIIFKRSLLISFSVMLIFTVISFWAKQTYIGCSVDDLIMQTALPVQSSFGDSIDNEEKTVYLTFDDGPSKTTQVVLEILKQEDIKATFFVMAASNNEQYLPLISTIVEQGHLIGLHTCSHRYEDIYQSSEAFWQDIENLKEKLSTYGVDNSTVLRFPGGSSNTINRQYSGGDLMTTLKQQALEKGYSYFDWTVDSKDAIGGSRDAMSVYNRVINQAQEQNTCIVLMHDTNATSESIKALPDIIAWFKNAGYSFDTLDNFNS